MSGAVLQFPGKESENRKSLKRWCQQFFTHNVNDTIAFLNESLWEDLTMILKRFPACAGLQKTLCLFVPELW